MYKTDPSTGNVIDCDSWSNIFQGVCWNPTAPTVVLAPGTTAPDGSVVPAVPASPATSGGNACGITDVLFGNCPACSLSDVVSGSCASTPTSSGGLTGYLLVAAAAAVGILVLVMAMKK
jgi:hypothetical protein